MGIRVFIGSSSEARGAMEEVASWIEDAGHTPRPWTDFDVFPLASTAFDALHDAALEVDAALFVFGEDDAVWYRGDKTASPRDNVLLEYGLFSGVLGATSVAIALVGQPRLATDLLGITCLPLSHKAGARLRLKNWLSKITARPRHHGRAPAHTFFTTADPEDREFAFSSRLTHAKTVDLLGYSMAHLLATSKTQLASAIVQGLTARIVLLDPHSTAGRLMAAKVGDFDRVLEPHERSVRYIREIVTMAAAGKANGRVDVKLMPWVPSCYMNIIDAGAATGEALIGLNALSLGPTLPRRLHFMLSKATDGPSFDFFVAQFNELWKSASTVSLLTSPHTPR